MEEREKEAAPERRGVVAARLTLPAARARRGRPEDLRDILAEVPDAPPVPGDEK